MPFVDDTVEDWKRPLKRRKITENVDMARFRRDSASSQEPEEPVEDQRHHVIRRRKDSFEETAIRTSDRGELMQCIKRGQHATWVPKPNLEALCVEADAQAEAILIKQTSSQQGDGDLAASHGQTERTAPLSEEPTVSQRVPSALHTGDFGVADNIFGSAREIPRNPRRSLNQPQTPFADSPPPWTTASPFSRFQRTISDPAGLDRLSIGQRNRSRAPSIGSSLSSSYIMRQPTSPLVHATSNLSIDKDPDLHDSSISANNNLSSLDSSPSFTPPGLRRETTMPSRSHQYRRSLTSFTYQPAASASTVYPSRQRRLSHASESTSLQRNSMVGSFEESILRGRMSTAPSTPLQFVAKIGVMGKGDCPAKLKCPAHVMVPFPAVFYNYPSSAGPRTISDDSPSPYVGTINLRDHLEAPGEPQPRKRRSLGDELGATLAGASSPTDHRTNALTTGSPAPRSPIGGAYRVPQQGQLQIILKNPENTAVKLFLVPYDLEGMPPDTKTFVRQRSFSTGPIMENVLSEKPIQDPLSTKQVLRYTIHLKFCCIGKGRFYLYDNIRVVFANRVPDGKEQLRNEVQLPEPRYSVMSLSKSQPESRRQSGVEGFLPSPSTGFGSPGLDMLDGLVQSSPSPMSANTTAFRLAYNGSPTPLRKENIKLSDARHASNGTSNNLSRPTSPEYGFERSSVSQRSSPVPWGTAIDLQPRSPSPALNGDGLLSKKLRELGRHSAKTSLPDGSNEMAQ